MYRSPTSHFAQTRHHQTSVYASARFLFETGERNGAPISSRRSCGRRSCSTALSPRSYARPLNINKRRHGVLDSPLCRSANKACALLIGPGPAVNPIDLHTQTHRALRGESGRPPHLLFSVWRVIPLAASLLVNRAVPSGTDSYWRGLSVLRTVKQCSGSVSMLWKEVTGRRLERNQHGQRMALEPRRLIQEYLCIEPRSQ